VEKTYSFSPASLLRLVKSALVGIFASVADMAVLTILVEWFFVRPEIANMPALLLGSAIQFIGCRHFVFHSKHGSVWKQVGAFSFVEALSFALNAGVYFLLIRYTPIPYLIAKALCSVAIYFCLSYPLWKWIFHRDPHGPSVPEFEETVE